MSRLPLLVLGLAVVVPACAPAEPETASAAAATCVAYADPPGTDLTQPVIHFATT